MWQIILIPFVGTSLGAACVFLLRQTMSERLQRVFTGFATGVMVSASFFSLLQPALAGLKTGSLFSVRQEGRDLIMGLTDLSISAVDPEHFWRKYRGFFQIYS